MFGNRKEKNFELKTENRDTELKTLTEWISGQDHTRHAPGICFKITNALLVI